jgi:hypothetical protein
VQDDDETKDPSGVGPPVANKATIVGEPKLRADPFAVVFARVFPVLRTVHDSFDRDGLLAVAVREGRFLETHVHLDLSRKRVAHALIGRHQRCDLFLGHDPSISLRHSLLRAVRTDDDQVRTRLIDLASGQGFLTEDGTPCESLLAEGPLFVRAGTYHLLLLPTGGLGAPWRETAKATWASFPERVYLDRRASGRHGVVGEKKQPAKGPAKTSLVTQIVPPVARLRAPGPRVTPGMITASLILKSRSGEISHPVTDTDLERGLLVGRYDRCQLGGAENSLSRIHLLVVRDEDGTWAIDTASTNGTLASGIFDGEAASGKGVGGAVQIRAIRLDGTRELGLGGDLLLQWTPSQAEARARPSSRT